MDRSWGVAGAASLTAFFTVVMMTNSGFFYVALIEEFGVTRESASWPMSIMSIVAHSSGLLISWLQQHMSVFLLGLMGSIFLWAGILGAVFAPDIAWMTVTLGAVHGVGVGVVCVTLVIVVMMYFDRYRGVASGLKYAGYSLASLLFPRILTSLRDAYGFRGCMLVYAALTMNVTALTLLLKEPPWHTSSWNSNSNKCVQKRNITPSISPTPKDRESCNSAASSKITNSDDATPGDYISTVSSLTPNCIGVAQCISSWTARSEAPVTYSRCGSNKYRSGNAKSANASQSSLGSFTCVGMRGSTRERMTSQNKSQGKSSSKTPNEVFEEMEASQIASQKPMHPRSRFGELRNLLTKPRFCVCILAVLAMDYTMAVFPATIVDYALDKGSSRNDADLSVTYCSPAELVGRVVLPLIGDCKVVSRTTLVAGSFFLLAVTMLALPATPSFLTYILVCACATMLLACLLAMKPVVIADYFGIENLATSWGIGGVTLLPLLLCSPYIIARVTTQIGHMDRMGIASVFAIYLSEEASPAIGHFRDARGSYDGLYQLQAGMHCFVAGLFGVLSLLDRRRQRKERATNLLA